MIVLQCCRSLVTSMPWNPGHLASRGSSCWDLGRGTTRHKSVTSREIRDGWQPYSQHCIDCLTSMCQASSSSSVAAAGHERGGRRAAAMMATFNSPSDNCTSSSSSTHDWFSIVPALTSALDPPLATWVYNTSPVFETRSSAIAEGPRDASCQLKPC